jgi:hypothetical protein
LSPGPSLLADPALRGILARGLDAPPRPETARLAAYVARLFGPAVLALVHYGSHAQGSGASPESAHDFFVILEDYGRGYTALTAALPTGYTAATASLLNRVLPPNVLSIAAPGEESQLRAKCAVICLRDLQRACSARPRDLFTLARLFQQVHLVWVRDPEARETVAECLLEARARTFEWGRPFLPPAFDAKDYCRALLQTAYGAEIRPEREERVGVLLEAQRDTLIPIYGGLLGCLQGRGELEREDGRFRDTRPPGPWLRLRARVFLARSKARATLRWIKYVALYDDWLDYVVHKAERRGGVPIKLTPRERRWPLIFLWPKALRVLGRHTEPRP